MTLLMTKDHALYIAERAVKKGASAAEVIFKRRSEFSVGIRLSEVETLKEATDRGMGLRVLLDGRQASVSGSDFQEDAIDNLIKEAIDLVRVTSVDDNICLPSWEDLAAVIEDLDLYDEQIELLSTQDKINISLRAE